MKIHSIDTLADRHGISNSAAKRMLRRSTNKGLQALPPRGTPVAQTGKRKVRKTT